MPSKPPLPHSSSDRHSRRPTGGDVAGVAPTPVHAVQVVVAVRPEDAGGGGGAGACVPQQQLVVVPHAGYVVARLGLVAHILYGGRVPLLPPPTVLLRDLTRLQE